MEGSEDAERSAERVGRRPYCWGGENLGREEGDVERIGEGGEDSGGGGIDSVS